MNTKYMENVYISEMIQAHENGYDICILGGAGAKKLRGTVTEINY